MLIIERDYSELRRESRKVSIKQIIGIDNDCNFSYLRFRPTGYPMLT